MAKRRSSKAAPRRRRSAGKRKAVRHHKAATPLGASAGMLASGYAIIGNKQIDNHGTTASILDHVLAPTRPADLIQRVVYIGKKNVTSVDTYVPALGGIAISAIGPKIPVIGPAINRTLRRMSKGKVSL